MELREEWRLRGQGFRGCGCDETERWRNIDMEGMEGMVAFENKNKKGGTHTHTHP